MSDAVFLVTWVTHNSRISERMIKYRIKRGKPIIFDNHMRNYIFKILLEIIEKQKYQVHALNVLSDHVHCVISCEENSLSKIVGLLKGMSSRKFNSSGVNPAVKVSDKRYSDGTCAKLWARGFNHKYLNHEKQFLNAMEYTSNNHLKHGLPSLTEGFTPLISTFSKRK